jgi:hypothetical protein
VSSADGQSFDFPSILGAVKPRARSRQYKILAALYSLGATHQPVTAAALVEVLATHLGASKVPVNVPAILRKYSTLIRVAGREKQLRWLLTDAGVQRLRDLSGLSLPRKVDEEQFGIDVAVVCALDHPEFSAVVNALGGAAKWREVGTARYTHVYRETELATDSGKTLKVVATTSSSMGLTAASIVTTQWCIDGERLREAMRHYDADVGGNFNRDVRQWAAELPERERQVT